MFQATPLTFQQPVALHPAARALHRRAGDKPTPPNRACGVARTISRAIWALCTPTKGPGDGNGESVHSYSPRPASLLWAGCSLWKVLLQPRLKSGLFIREVSNANQTSWRPQTPILVKGRLARTEGALSQQIARQKDGQNDEAHGRGAASESAQSWIALRPSPVS
jgi:hypothetical protein